MLAVARKFMQPNRARDSLNGAGTFEVNFLKSLGDANFTADADGLGRVFKESKNDGDKTYLYRANGSLARFSDKNSQSVYYYDGIDRLVAKAITEDGAQFIQSYVNLTDESRVLLGKSGDNSLTVFVDGKGFTERLGEVKNSQGTGYITDHLGSVINSPLVGLGRSYGLFGEVTSKIKFGTDASPINYGYTGHSMDLESGLFRTMFRQYSPKLGRWQSMDPAGITYKNQNLYGYVNNNPASFTDPLGLYACFYSIATHSMTCIANDPAHSDFSSSNFVSGHGTTKNDPNSTNVSNSGPIPKGSYDIGSPINDLGRRRLSPWRGTELFGRSAFQLHGCSNPDTCSDGCVAATTNSTRDKLNELLSTEEGENSLTVY